MGSVKAIFPLESEAICSGADFSESGLSIPTASDGSRRRSRRVLDAVELVPTPDCLTGGEQVIKCG